MKCYHHLYALLDFMCKNILHCIWFLIVRFRFVCFVGVALKNFFGIISCTNLHLNQVPTYLVWSLSFNCTILCFFIRRKALHLKLCWIIISYTNRYLEQVPTYLVWLHYDIISDSDSVKNYRKIIFFHVFML